PPSGPCRRLPTGDLRRLPGREGSRRGAGGLRRRWASDGSGDRGPPRPVGGFARRRRARLHRQGARPRGTEAARGPARAGRGGPAPAGSERGGPGGGLGDPPPPATEGLVRRPASRDRSYPRPVRRTRGRTGLVTREVGARLTGRYGPELRSRRD